MSKNTRKSKKCIPPQFNINSELIRNILGIRSLKSYLEPLIKLQKWFQGSLEPLIQIGNQIKQIQDQVQKIFEPIIRTQLQVQKFAKQIAKRRKIEREVMLKTGWWHTPSLMEVRANWISQALCDYKNGKKAAITNLFKKVYHRSNYQYLKEVVKNWNKNPFFKPRIEVIKDALEVHCHKKYTLSIPALLLTAEGIATDYCKKAKIYKKSDKSKGGEKIKKALKDKMKKLGRPAWLISWDLDFLFSAIDNIIYQNTDRLKRSRPNYKNFLNRHAILHGLQKNYATSKNSLQCFMLLDVLSQLK